MSSSSLRSMSPSLPSRSSSPAVRASKAVIRSSGVRSVPGPAPRVITAIATPTPTRTAPNWRRRPTRRSSVSPTVCSPTRSHSTDRTIVRAYDKNLRLAPARLNCFFIETLDSYRGVTHPRKGMFGPCRRKTCCGKSGCPARCSEGCVNAFPRQSLANRGQWRGEDESDWAWISRPRHSRPGTPSGRASARRRCSRSSACVSIDVGCHRRFVSGLRQPSSRPGPSTRNATGPEVGARRSEAR